jgi:hypothetical protein
MADATAAELVPGLIDIPARRPGVDARRAAGHPRPCWKRKLRPGARLLPSFRT